MLLKIGVFILCYLIITTSLFVIVSWLVGGILVYEKTYASKLDTAIRIIGLGLSFIIVGLM